MNTTHDDGGPAFPQGNPEMVIPGQSVKETQGMSLRDWFAGMALQGWLASFDSQMTHPAKLETTTDIAADSYSMADAMLAARKEAK